MQYIEAIIKGRVQGVFFRAQTQKQALNLNIKGSVSNLNDGCVKVIAGGKEASIKQLLAWLQQGPRLARVDEVNYKVIPAFNSDSFIIK